MKIYGDTNSGNCLKVKWVCDHLALPYSWIAVDTLKGETRTAEFLKLNSAGQVPPFELDDGRTLAQSNAIIRYLARGSRLIPPDAYAEAKMDEWLFWEQYSHEPYIAVCRFQMFYLGKPASDLDPGRSSAATQRWRGWSRRLPLRRSWPARMSRSPTCRCWPIPAWRTKAASISIATPPCAAGSARPKNFSACRGALTSLESFMPTTSDITIRRARREDVGPIVRHAGGRSARRTARADRRPVAAMLRRGFRATLSATPIFSSSSRRTGRAPSSAACNSACCRGSARRAPRAA